MPRYLTSCAIAAMLLVAPSVAVAQVDAPADPAAPAQTDVAPAETTPADPALAGDPAAPGAGQLELIDGFIVGQSPEQILSTNILNVDVIGSDGEQIGSVDDILIDRDGNVLGIIVGVGGFLGIGERDVAIPIEAVEFVLGTDAQTMDPVAAPDAPAPAPADPATPPADPAAPAAPADPAVPPADPAAPGAPADPAAPAAPGTGWGWWGGDGPLQYIQVNATEAQLEAAPEFTRTDATW